MVPGEVFVPSMLSSHRVLHHIDIILLHDYHHITTRDSSRYPYIGSPIKKIPMATISIPVETNYNENLVNTIKLLHTVHNELLGQVVNLALSGDLETLQDQMGDDEAINLKYADFTALPDTNIQHMIELIEVLKDKMRVLVNANQIQTADLH